jgi:hypothetical protein
VADELRARNAAPIIEPPGKAVNLSAASDGASRGKTSASHAILGNM